MDVKQHGLYRMCAIVIVLLGNYVQQVLSECDDVEVSKSQYNKHVEGVYKLMQGSSLCNGRPRYKREVDIFTTYYVFHTGIGWMVGSSLCSSSGWIHANDLAPTPHLVSTTWEEAVLGVWVSSPDLKVGCPGLSTGVIAVIVLLVIAACVCIPLIVVVCVKKRKPKASSVQQETSNQNDLHVQAGTAHPSSPGELHPPPREHQTQPYPPPGENQTQLYPPGPPPAYGEACPAPPGDQFNAQLYPPAYPPPPAYGTVMGAGHQEQDSHTEIPPTGYNSSNDPVWTTQATPSAPHGGQSMQVYPPYPPVAT